MTRAWLIVGCGYTGTQLARTLGAQGRAGEVTITRRNGEVARALGAALGARGERLDLTDLTGLTDLADPGAAIAVTPGAIVVSTAPPGGDPAGEIRALLALARDAARLVYVSSTGVYGHGHAAWVDETWPVAPITESGRARPAAEAALAGAAVPW